MKTHPMIDQPSCETCKREKLRAVGQWHTEYHVWYVLWCPMCGSIAQGPLGDYTWYRAAASFMMTPVDEDEPRIYLYEDEED